MGLCIGPPLCPSDCPPRSFARRSRSRDACWPAGKAGTPPAALIQLAPASILKEYARQGRFLSAHCDPVDPPDSINVYGFKLGREYILSAQTLPIEEESAWYTGPVCLLHGTSDRIVPISYSERYHQLYRHSEFHRLRGTEHLFLFHRRKVRHLILEFLSREKQ